jgi:hypothetical protein
LTQKRGKHCGLVCRNDATHKGVMLPAPPHHAGIIGYGVVNQELLGKGD